MDQYISALLKRKTLLVAGFLLFMIFILFNFSVVYIKDDLNSTVYRKLTSENSEFININHRLGIHRTGEMVVEKKYKNQISRKTVNIRPFWFNKVEISSKNQKLTQKVAKDTKECIVGSKEEILNKYILSYDCVGVSKIAKSDYTLSSSILDNVYSIESAVPVKNGFAGIDTGVVEDEFSGNNFISYIDSSGQKTIQVIGSSLDTTNILMSNLSSIFLLDQAQKKVYKIEDFSQSKVSNFSDINIPDDDDCLITRTQASLKYLYVYCIGEVGSTNTITDSDEIKSGKLIKYEIDNKYSKTEYQIQDADLLKNLNDFTVLDDDRIAVKNITNKISIEIFKTTKNRLSFVQRIPKAIDIVPFEDNIFVLTEDGAVFESKIGSNESYAVFFSGYSKVKKIQSSEAGLLISTETSQRLPSSSVLLLNTKLVELETSRIEDVLPYKEESGTPLYTIDYIDQQIIVSVPPPSYEFISLDQIKTKVLEYLNSKNLDTNKFTYTYR